MSLPSDAGVLTGLVSHKNFSGAFKVNSLRTFSFYGNLIYTHAKLKFLVTIYTVNH